MWRHIFPPDIKAAVLEEYKELPKSLCCILPANLLLSNKLALSWVLRFGRQGKITLPLLAVLNIQHFMW